MQKAPRSRTVLLSTASEMPEISNWSWDTILPQEDDEFYETFEYQVRYLQQKTMINIQTLCKLLRISTATYYALFPLHNNSIPQSSQNSPGRPPLTSVDDENALLTYIRECQMSLNCIRPKEAREWLQNYILETKH